MPTKEIFSFLGELAKNQGFTVALLVAGMIWMSYQDHLNRQQRANEIQRLQVEIRECSKRILEFYERDHEEMRRQMELNNHLLEDLDR